MTQARDIIYDALATAMHAMQTTVATTLGSTLGALAFATGGKNCSRAKIAHGLTFT
jgi:hypothetical protein